MILSIILPAFKRPDLVERGLNAILNQNIKSKYEIIVLNDGVDDDTKNICNKFKKKIDIKYIFTGQRNKNELVYRCPSFAINIGVKKAKGELILLTSPEMYYLTPNCLNTMIGLTLINPKSLIIPEKGYDDQTGTITREILNGRKAVNLEKLPSLNVTFPFCMMLYKKEFIDIGGYDEDFIGYCYDDADLVDRFIANNLTFIRATNHKIIHLFHGFRNNREGLKNRSGQLNYNKKLYEERKNIIIRNKDKNWGLNKMNKREEEFTDTYINNRFKGKVSKSGTGSDLENTKFLIDNLSKFFRENNIKNIIDAPCGDFNWIPFVLNNTAIENYKGYDIVEKLIEDNKKKFPGVLFEQKDIVEEGNFGKADLLLCRDCLVHLSFKSAKRVIKNFFQSDIKYLLTTHFSDGGRINSDFKDGTNWYPINLTKAPFFLPEPKIIINEGCTENNGKFTDKSLALWEKTDLINYVDTF